MGWIGDQIDSIKSMQFRQLFTQAISLGMIVTSALIIWKGLMCVTGSESPVVVVLSGSMEPGFKRGDILFLHMSKEPIRAGEIVVFNVDGREIPIVHRVIKVHEHEDGEVDVLTKGDNNFGDDRLLYAHGQMWLHLFFVFIFFLIFNLKIYIYIKLMAIRFNPPVTTMQSGSFTFRKTANLRSPKFSMASTIGSSAPKVETIKKPFTPPREVHVQVTHSMPPQKMEIFKSIEGWAEQNILTHLKPVDKCWQPQDFLPDPASDGFIDQVKELRERAKELPDDYFVVLVGDMVTEEALPTYQTMLNTLDGVRDETGASLTPWAVWTRAWTAEENRHGDLLHQYLYLCGRVDMRQIDVTTQYLIGSGMDPRTENNPYLGFIYTSFQERATFISHGNTARHAKEHGDLKLAQICGTIAADEKRHETAYTKIVEKLFEIDPDGTVLAFADMMRKKISMPAHLMYDGRDDHLFDHFSAVAQRLGVYTAKDYADILEFLVGRWKVAELNGLSGEGRKAQEYVCGLPSRIRRLEERASAKAKEGPTISFSWIFDRQVKL